MSLRQVLSVSSGPNFDERNVATSPCKFAIQYWPPDRTNLRGNPSGLACLIIDIEIEEATHVSTDVNVGLVHDPAVDAIVKTTESLREPKSNTESRPPATPLQTQFELCKMGTKSDVHVTPSSIIHRSSRSRVRIRNLDVSRTSLPRAPNHQTPL